MTNDKRQETNDHLRFFVTFRPASRVPCLEFQNPFLNILGRFLLLQDIDPNQSGKAKGIMQIGTVFLSAFKLFY